MGTKDVDETIKACAAYTLAPVADRIRQDILILAGTEDHFVPFHQTADFEKALVNARSVTTRIFDRAIGWRWALPGGRLNALSRSRFRLAPGEVPRKSKASIGPVVG